MIQMKSISIVWLVIVLTALSVNAQDDRATEDQKETESATLNKPPMPVNLNEVKSQFDYPKKAFEAGIEGRVIFKVLIDEDGRYVKHVVVISPHSLLTKESEKHLPKLRFTPAIQKGKALPVWVSVPFDFKIDIEQNPGGNSEKDGSKNTE